jgi:hypothetical protein
MYYPLLPSSMVGPYRKCCHVQTKAHGDVFKISPKLGISHSQIYLMYNIMVKHAQTVFRLNTAPFRPSIFCWKFVLIGIVLSYLSVDRVHHTLLYTVVYGTHSRWCWCERSKLARDLEHKAFCLFDWFWMKFLWRKLKMIPILFFLLGNVHMLFAFTFCIRLYVY